MSFLDTTYLDNGVSPFVYSITQYREPDGSEQTAKIAVEPFGPVPVALPLRRVERWVSFTLSVDEAEALASRLAEVVAAARAGNFDGSHENLNSFRREAAFRRWTALTEAWAVLGADYDESLYGSSL
jgi:hypothetical protein